MPSASTTSGDAARKRSDERAARELLLAEDLRQEGAAPQGEADPGPGRGQRRPLAFLAAFFTALLLAGGSWLISSRGSTVEVPVVISLEPAPTQPAPASELLLRLGQFASVRDDGVRQFREEVGAASGEVLLRPDGVIKAVRIDSSRLRALVDALEREGLAFLEVTPGEAEAAPPIVAEGGDWQEWSTRLQLRRAIRRLERSGGTLVVGVSESG